MADLKPIGSEKLQGQEKLNRILEIARYKENIPNSVNETSKIEFGKTLADGNQYEIVKEKSGYVIKKRIDESLDYVEPMKNRKYYRSYSQALKRMNLLAGELNRLNENEEEVSMFSLEEQKKFTLKLPNKPEPQMDAPAPELPADDMDVDMDAEMDMDLPMGDEEVSMDAEVDAPEMGMEPEAGAEEEVDFKVVQKLTGKLGQKIRTMNDSVGMTSEDVKYVLNSILSALDLEKLDDEDREDVIAKIEEIETDYDSDEMDMDMDLTGDEELGLDLDMEEPVEGEMGEERYGSFGHLKRKDSKGDTYYDEFERIAKDSDIYGIGDDEMFDTEEFETFKQLYDKYGDKQKWFSKNDGERMFDLYKQKTGKPFKVKTRKLEGEMGEEIYGSFGNLKRKDSKGDTYYNEFDRKAKDVDLYGIGDDEMFDTEEFETFKQLYDKYGDKQKWFSKNDGERMFDLYKQKTGKPFKVKTRKLEGEMGEGDDMYLGIGDHGFYDKSDRQMNDFNFDYDEEEYDDFDDFISKYPNQNWFRKGRSDDAEFGRDSSDRKFWDRYKEKFGGPFKLRKRRSEMGEEFDGKVVGVYSNIKKQRDEEMSEEDMNKSQISKIMDTIFSESKVDKVLEKYFVINESETKKTKKNSPEKLAETVEQKLAVEFIMSENSNMKFLGKTNKGNLVFENKGEQFKVTTKGELI
jgi:hypothetical protein